MAKAETAKIHETVGMDCACVICQEWRGKYAKQAEELLAKDKEIERLRSFWLKAEAEIERLNQQKGKGELKVLTVALAYANKERKAQAREIEKHRWIPVSERLPEESGYYQVVREINRYPSTREYCAKSLMWLSREEVTHWKPIVLPEQKPE